MFHLFRISCEQTVQHWVRYQRRQIQISVELYKQVFCDFNANGRLFPISSVHLPHWSWLSRMAENCEIFTNFMVSLSIINNNKLRTNKNYSKNSQTKKERSPLGFWCIRSTSFLTESWRNKAYLYKLDILLNLGKLGESSNNIERFSLCNTLFHCLAPISPDISLLYLTL